MKQWNIIKQMEHYTPYEKNRNVCQRFLHKNIKLYYCSSNRSIFAKRIVSSIISQTLSIGRNEQIEEKIAGAVN